MRTIRTHFTFAFIAAAPLVTGCGSAAVEDSASTASSTRDETTAASAGLVGGFQDVAHDSATLRYEAVFANASCTGARISARQILTAAHCVQGENASGRGNGLVRATFAHGEPLLISRSVVVDANASYEAYEIATTVIHPGWTAACGVAGCLPNQSVQPTVAVGPLDALLPGFAPDIAIITLTEDLPASWPTAKLDFRAAPEGTDVMIGGYGCEVGVGGPAPTPPRHKIDLAKLLPTTAVNDVASVVQADSLPLFGQSYFLTAGAHKDAIEGASLCPGDSGGPVYRHEFPNSNKLLGLNAYYTFASSDHAVSHTNIHTRVGNGEAPYFVKQWLQTNAFAGTIFLE